MSLQVWLPLNGNLNNQGLSEVNITNSGATVDSNGKIGSCYLVNSDKRIFFSSYPWMTMKPQYDFSCFFWVKGTTSGWLFACSAWEFRLRPDYIQVHLGGSGAYAARYTDIFDTNTWYHLGFTWSGTEGKLRLYLNGNSVATSDVPSSASYDIASSFNIPYDGPRYINDFRLYDHCLSAKEVKEISKGLICHYKLDNKGFGNPNLFVTQFPSDFSRQGNKYTSTVADSRTNDSFQLQYFKGSTYDSTFYSQDVYTTPCDVKTTFTVPTNITGVRVKFNGASRDIDLFSASRAPVSPGETYTLSLRVLSSKSEVIGGVQVENPKLEKGSVVTPWCPHTSSSLYTSLELNSTIESDCSGYNYNGTLSESLPYASGSPRYDGCYYFNSTSKRITLPAINMSGFSNSFSISWWGKAPSYSGLMYWGFSNGNRLNYYDGLYCNTGDGGSNPYYKPNTTTTISTPSVDTWHHFVMVGDGSSNKLYMDGELYGVAKTYVGIIGNTIVINGWDSSTSYKTNGYISDFRIYSTALSASNIKELYNTSASVDKNGNMYAYEFKEE